MHRLELIHQNNELRWATNRRDLSVIKEAYREPSEVEQAIVDQFVARLKTHLSQAVRPGHGAFGDKVSATVDNMVAPGVRERYRKTDAVIGLASFEVSQIGQKIRRYQYIERYKFFFDAPDPEIGMGFAEHMYALRNAELYAVLERGETIVRFVSAIGAELGIGSVKAPTKYNKSFREKFERRLRERHKITHAHERPSLVSRMLQLGGLKTDNERKKLENVLGDIFGAMNMAMEAIQDKVPEADRAPSPTDPTAFQTWYLQRVDGEAATMWKTFSDAVASAAGLSIAE